MSNYGRYSTGSSTNYGTVSGIGGIQFSGTGATLKNLGTIIGSVNNGVELLNGGHVINQVQGYISGGFAGVRSETSATIDNQGTISGNVFGVLLAGGTVNNVAPIGFDTARISGGLDGVSSSAYASVSVGYGLIEGGRFGVNLAGGNVQVEMGGGIFGNTAAVYIAGAAGIVDNNSGVIAGGLTGHHGDGIDLMAGGSISNANVIESYGGRAIYVYAASSYPSISNTGVIRAFDANSVGILIKESAASPGAKATIVNGVSGTITGYTGISIVNGAYVSNYGLIEGSVGSGIQITNAAGEVVNKAGGQISGAVYGVQASGILANIVNYGSISGAVGIGFTQADCEINNAGGSIYGANGAGVFLGAGGSISNTNLGSARGSIYGASSGVFANGGAWITNAGDIIGVYQGIVLTGGGSVTNSQGGDISGHNDGVLVEGGNATITDAGVIGGGQDAVLFTGGGVDRLILDPGAVLNGAVSGAGASTTLELAKGGAGTVSGLGSAITGLKSLVVDSGATWTAAGTNTVAKATGVNVKGSLTVTGSTTFAGAIGGPGTLAVGAHASLTVSGLFGASSMRFLAGGSETLTLGTPSTLGPLIAGFAHTDTIDLAHFVVATHTLAGTTLSLTASGGGAASLNFSSSYTGHHFTFASDGHGGTNIGLV